MAPARQISAAPYPIRVWLFVGPWMDMAAWALKRFKCDVGRQTHDAAAFGFGPEDGPDLARIVWLPSLCRDVAEDVLSASHEALHTAWWILDQVGVKTSADNSEALAYLHESLFRQILAAATP
jgi:hypothetical protein